MQPHQCKSQGQEIGISVYPEGPETEAVLIMGRGLNSKAEQSSQRTPVTSLSYTWRVPAPEPPLECNSDTVAQGQKQSLRGCNTCFGKSKLTSILGEVHRLLNVILLQHIFGYYCLIEAQISRHDLCVSRLNVLGEDDDFSRNCILYSVLVIHILILFSLCQNNYVKA